MTEVESFKIDLAAKYQKYISLAVFQGATTTIAFYSRYKLNSVLAPHYPPLAKNWLIEIFVQNVYFPVYSRVYCSKQYMI